MPTLVTVAAAGFGASVIAAASVLAAGMAEWSPETWIFVVSSIVTAAIAAWAKYQSGKAAERAKDADKTAQANSRRIDTVDAKVHDVAKALPPTGDGASWFNKAQPPDGGGPTL